MVLSVKEILAQSLKAAFPDFSDPFPLRFFSAPGRINLIGEHVDYAGGTVFPAAIDFRVFLAVRKNGREDFRIYSQDFQSELITNSLAYSETKTWANYILGVISEARKKGLSVQGFDLAFTGNIPQGAGLSSSAAVEVGTAFALSQIFSWGISREEIALLSQSAENHFVGVNCGIMDQFVIATAKPSSCISLDTESLEYSYHSLDLPGFEFYLIDSKVKHNLKESEYNDRRREVESATEKLRKFDPGLKNLNEADPENLNSVGLTETEKKRAEHILGERSRVRNVIRYLKEKDPVGLGKELYLCHQSLAEKFQVSCEETDFIVNNLHARNVLGARMIGGGFGGCILVLDKEGRSESVFSELQKEYLRTFGLEAKIYRFRISEGVREDT
ncbi:galactokinase [Leptospira langatensis]|uniref:Galactokinase n=1 Tax=Leptospira langatensis TaxID=2484983 RepID=A0A5F1ZVI3_9LEPT|nr:galactokinase [Leptospira langatensis]TGK01187.1 galactokinase [Leptospira langatensis]TGL42460.1 galactokinase [Leptospira langatensis]